MKNKVTIWLIFICLTSISAFGECIGGNTDYNDSKVFYGYTPDQTAEEPPVEPMEPPTKPIVKNIHFDPLVYDWEFDNIYVNSKLCFDIDSKNATFFWLEYACREDFWNFGIPDELNFLFIVELEINDAGQYVDSSVDLGDIIRIHASNSHGSVYGDPIAVNDYIEDPAILARLTELRNIATGIVKPESYLNSSKEIITLYRNHISINTDYVNDVDVYTLDGDKVLEYNKINNILDTSSLAKGVYIVAYTTYQNEKLTLKYIKQ